MPKAPLHAVILAGGPGSRFWPWSTPAAPKHALPLLPGGRSLFEDTVSRLGRLVPPERLWLVTTAPQARTLRRLAPALRRDRVIVEPEARDTAAAIGVAALRVAAVDPGAVMAVCPADHRVLPASAFVRQVRAAAALAARDACLVTFGVRPDRPATTYGYLRVGGSLGTAGGVAFRRVAAFKEKPDLPTARRYLASRGRFLWNSGIFVWKAEVLLSALARHAPALHRGLNALAPHLGTAREAATLKRRYPRLPRISIDYAVMESAARVAVARAAFSWSDWGTWTAWEATLKPDVRGNRVYGNARVSGCRDTTAIGADPRRPLRVADARGHLVVQAPAGLLVCGRDQAEDLKRLLAEGGRP